MKKSKNQKFGSKEEPKITISKPKIKIIEKEKSNEKESGLEEEVEEASEELHEEGTRMLSSSILHSNTPSQTIPEFPENSESQAREEATRVVRYNQNQKITEEERMRGYEEPQEERLVVSSSGMEQTRHGGVRTIHSREDGEDNDLIRRNNRLPSESNFQNPDDKKYEHRLPDRKKRTDMY